MVGRIRQYVDVSLAFVGDLGDVHELQVTRECALRYLHAALAQARDEFVLRADQLAADDLADGGETLCFLIHSPIINIFMQK